MTALVVCTGCSAQNFLPGLAESRPAEGLSVESGPKTELVPVLDDQSLDLLQEFHLAGTFHEGAAFVASYTSLDQVSIEGKLECGYVTTDGEYIPLYTVPQKICLMNPARSYDSYHIDQSIEVETALFLDKNLLPGPFVSQQKVLDDVLARGDNGCPPAGQPR